jgi:hypothetical protein
MPIFKITRRAVFVSEIEVDIDSEEADNEHDVWEMANAGEFKYLFEKARDLRSHYEYDVQQLD